jgi:hypothetical protein
VGSSSRTGAGNSGHTIGRDPDRFGDIAEGIFSQGAVVRLTEKQAYGRGIRSIAEQIVDGGQIEVELARPLGLELSRLQLDDKVAVQPEMIEEQIDVEGLTADLERHLAADEGEPAAKLQEKVAKMFEEATLQLPLFGSRAQGQKLERIWILKECRVRSESGAGSVRSKFVSAFPSLSRSCVEMWWVSTFRLQPYSREARRYHSRLCPSLRRSSRTIW